jgi:AcrR family transcriptional regulator
MSAISSKTKTRTDTRSAIMDSAETLLAEHGINGVSLREILRDAQANPAALNYHFGSKDGLIQAILDRHGHATKGPRLEMIRALENTDTQPTIAELIDVMVDPLLEFLHEEGESGRRFLRFLARLHSDRTGIILRMEQEKFPDMARGMRRVTAAACAHLPKPEQMRRLVIVLDAMYHSLANADVMTKDWNANDHAAELDEHVATLKRFLCGGLSAPPS